MMKILVYGDSFEEWLKDAHVELWGKWLEGYEEEMSALAWIGMFHPEVLDDCPYVLR